MMKRIGQRNAEEPEKDVPGRAIFLYTLSQFHNLIFASECAKGRVGKANAIASILEGRHFGGTAQRAKKLRVAI